MVVSFHMAGYLSGHSHRKCSAKSTKSCDEFFHLRLSTTTIQHQNSCNSKPKGTMGLSVRRALFVGEQPAGH